ncbi:MAG: type II toxin-antitoxin system RelE/ParE family toxin [Deltaproteobacteria bacterium]|nr:type II toxin-antitoxin system RelE/ParE family toxin [Deltaproteobacteria bacterium]
MSLPVVFRPEARTEVVEAWVWYEEQRPGLGDEMVACLDAAVAAASRNPEAYARNYGEARRALVRRFPYAVFYMVEGGELVVLAVAHTSRKPGYWADRIRTRQT